VFGNEAQGLPDDVVDGVDTRVTIPMPGRAESLNLGMAASILLYEARRQRAGILTP
jgi:RNA methyltransferase, TrmH family